MDYYIVREGWPFIAAALAIFVITLMIGSWFFILPAAAILFFIILFFRNPERVVSNGDDIVVSPADGTVIYAAKGKISIFMSVFNVHVNRVPVNGVVRKIAYNKGRFLVASRDKASLDNEQNAIFIEDNRGRTVKFVQIAGFIARRIVCYLKEGDNVTRGERFGMIRFGSRVDVYLPAGANILVKNRQKVYAGSFHKIIAAASFLTGDPPKAWEQMLVSGGRMVLPVRNSIYVYTKNEDGSFAIVEHPGFAFVPLLEGEIKE